MREFINHFVSQELYQRLESVLVKLDLKHLDIDFTLQVCKRYNLFHALIRIYNLCLNDYITPINETIKICLSYSQSEQEPGSGYFTAGVEIIFNYLVSCITQDASEGSVVTKECLEFLFCVKPIDTSDSSTIGTPILKTLASFNCQKLLFLSEICLDLPLKTLNITINTSKDQPRTTFDKMVIIQSLLYLSFIMKEATEINIFISKMLIRHSLPLNLDIVEDLIVKLSNTSSDDQHSTVQDSVISLLEFYSLETNLVEVFQTKKFWKVVEYIGRKNSRCDLIFEGLINDSGRRQTLLASLDLLFSSAPKQDFETFKDLIYLYLETLVSLEIGISSIVSTYSLDHYKSLSLLSPKYQLLYLSDLFSDLNFYNVKLYDMFLLLLCQLEPRKVKSQLLSPLAYTKSNILEACKSFAIIDAYLLLEPDPVQSLNFLKIQFQNPSCITPELLSESLEFCKKHSHLDFQEFYKIVFTSVSQPSEHSHSKGSKEKLLNLMQEHLSFPIFIQLLPSTLSKSEIRLILNQISHESHLYQILLEIIDEECISDLEKLVKTRRRATLHSIF